MPSPPPPIELDGSYGEGGGVLLRTALAVSSLTGIPVRVRAIRDATKFPGLNPEDITLVRAMASLTQAHTEHAELGSSQLLFAPTKRPRPLNERIGVAEGEDGPGFANAPLVALTLMPLLARTGAYSSFTAVGETYAHNNLSYDYFENVTLAALRRFGLYATARQTLAGFGWGARGQLEIEVEPSGLEGLQWQDRGRLLGVRGIVATGELIRTIGQRGADHLAALADSAKLPIEIEAVEVPSKGPGAFVTLCAEFEHGLGGSVAMGQKGVRMEAVVQRAYQGFMEWYESTATCDSHVIDQLILPAVFANGPTHLSTHRITPRLLTTVWVVKQFLPLHLTVRGRENEAGTVTLHR